MSTVVGSVQIAQIRVSSLLKLSCLEQLYRVQHLCFWLKLCFVIDRTEYDCVVIVNSPSKNEQIDKIDRENFFNSIRLNKNPSVHWF